MYYRTYLLWLLHQNIVKYIFCKKYKNKKYKQKVKVFKHPCKTASEPGVRMSRFGIRRPVSHITYTHVIVQKCYF